MKERKFKMRGSMRIVIAFAKRNFDKKYKNKENRIDYMFRK